MAAGFCGIVPFLAIRARYAGVMVGTDDGDTGGGTL
jgi:hypothetical protein